MFHVLKRGNERRTIFEADGDYLPGYAMADHDARAMVAAVPPLGATRAFVSGDG